MRSLDGGWPRLWHHLAPSSCGSSHPRLAPPASGGLDDDVADGVHHDRSLPTPLDTGPTHVPAEDDEAEGAHHALTLLTGSPPLDTSREDAEGVQDDAAGVVHALALLTGPLPLGAGRETLDTGLVSFLAHTFRTPLGSSLASCAAFRLDGLWGLASSSMEVSLSGWRGQAHSTIRWPRAMG